MLVRFHGRRALLLASFQPGFRRRARGSAAAASTSSHNSRDHPRMVARQKLCQGLTNRLGRARARDLAWPQTIESGEIRNFVEKWLLPERKCSSGARVAKHKNSHGRATKQYRMPSNGKEVAMIDRRQLLTVSGLLGALAPASGEDALNGAGQQLSAQAAQDIVSALRDIKQTMSAESSFAEIQPLRSRQVDFLKARGKFPDFIDVSADVW